MAALVAELGHPERGLRGALVAGTNGKGSTCAFLESILRAGGLRTGLMPKPHLSTYRERIQVSAEPISEADFARAVDDLRPAIERVTPRLGEPTEFEILTALAIAYLAPRIDRLVCEVGMGGRLDATNVLDLGVAVITNVALDHQQYLGDTIEQIAAEKAAIIKPGNQVITAAAPPALGIVEAAAGREGGALQRLGNELEVTSRSLGWDGSLASISGPDWSHHDLHVPLLGSYQPLNATLAVAAAHALGDATDEAVRAGVAATRWPGRLEVIGAEPRIVLDGGHNPAGLKLVVKDLLELAGRRRVSVVFGAMADKDLAAMLEQLHQLDPPAIVFTRAESAAQRAAPPAELVALWGGEGASAVEPATAALERAFAGAGTGDVVLVCGSLYLVGEVRDHLLPAS
ncbi:MAG TPA: Mur ligase family protein [Candidatus Dormibacteraeota bacterium]